MKKMRSTTLGLMLGMACGAFIWVVQAPRPWTRVPTASALSVQASVSPRTPPALPPQPTNFVPTEEFEVSRRETDVLPLVATRVSFEAPAVEHSVSLEVEELHFATPAAPEFAEADDPPRVHESDAKEFEELSSRWPVPTELMAQLSTLAERPGYGDWVQKAQKQFAILAGAERLDAPESAAALESLQRIADEARRLAAEATTPAEQARILAAGYAISRRLAVWDSIYRLASLPTASMVPVSARPDEMLPRLDAVDATLGQSPRSSHWRRYLLTGQTRLLAEAGDTVDQDQRRDHAQRVLRRMEWPGLSATQRRFLARPEFEALADELRVWAAEPFDLVQILETLEAYEQQPSAGLARRVTNYRRRLHWASHPQAADLAARLDEHYRNANVRAAVSQDLLLLFAPEVQTTIESVQDTIVGAAVRGKSQTTSHVAFKVLPDNRRLRLVLEAKGEVATDTRSSKSGAVFHSSGRAWFTAQKEIAYDGRNLLLAPAVAEARVYDNLRDVTTAYDSLPVVNVVAQSLARHGHADAQQAARREAELKVARRAASRLDSEAEKHLNGLGQRLENRVGKPLDHLSLFATPIDLQTTSSRLIGRYRLAGDSQLGAHTARPQAPADSVLSVQVHESAINNALIQLPLAGRETDLPGLFESVAAAVGFKSVSAPEDLPEKITLQLDAEEPVRIDMVDGAALITVRLDYLKTPGRTWRNITTRAFYEPVAEGSSARLQRTRAVQLTGDHLRMRDQLALRAIFSKVFSERRALNLIPPTVAQSEKLQSYEVTQLVVRDGWLGLALGPRRTVQNHTAQK